MPDGDGLASAVADIDKRMDQIGHAIEAARKQVEQAARAVEEVKRNQAQQQAALNTLSAQLDAAIRENREGIDDLRKRVDDVSASIADLADRSRSMQDMLQTIIAQQLEEKLRRERESEWASFILRLHGILRRIGDPAVRVVFAFDALKAIERRKLRSTSFLGAADQAAMDEKLYIIECAGTDLSEPHRTEADAFMRLRALDRDAVGLRSRWQEQIRKLLEDTTSAENHVTEARRLLLNAEAPEPEDVRRRRRSSRITLTTLAVLIVFAALAGAVAVDLGFAWAVPVAFPFAVFAWLRSDAHRRQVLARRREKLAGAERSLLALHAAGPEMERQQRSELAAIRTRWRVMKLDMPSAAELDEPAAAVSAAYPVIAGAKAIWERHHPEIDVLAR